MNHLLLYMLLRESGPSLKGQKIEAIRILRPILSIELHRRSERQYLVVVLSTPGPFFFCSATDPVGAAGAAVLKRIHGERISAETEPPADRIVHLQLGKEALVTTLFGSGARVRVQSGDHIIESIDPAV
jgi:hypothetical protein